MEQIKLEVGKKYRVRNPKEVKASGHVTSVKILKNDGSVFSPFLGDDDCWYEANGKLFNDDETVYDLVQEIGKNHGGKRREGSSKARKTFTIDIDLLPYLDSMVNASAHICYLLRKEKSGN